MNKDNFSPWFGMIPLIVAALFAVLMFYAAVISTQKARDDYHAKKTHGDFQLMSQKLREASKPEMPAFPNDKSPTPTPAPVAKPPESLVVRVLKQMDYYETSYLFSFIFLLSFGLQFAGLTLGFSKLKSTPLLKMSQSFRRSLFAMLTSFTLSPALLILYIWALRVGLIG